MAQLIFDAAQDIATGTATKSPNPPTSQRISFATRGRNMASNSIRPYRRMPLMEPPAKKEPTQAPIAPAREIPAYTSSSCHQPIPYRLRLKRQNGIGMITANTKTRIFMLNLNCQSVDDDWLLTVHLCPLSGDRQCEKAHAQKQRKQQRYILFHLLFYNRVPFKHIDSFRRKPPVQTGI